MKLKLGPEDLRPEWQGHQKFYVNTPTFDFFIERAQKAIVAVGEAFFTENDGVEVYPILPPPQSASHKSH
jgi:hypothetical protein